MADDDRYRNRRTGPTADDDRYRRTGPRPTATATAAPAPRLTTTVTAAPAPRLTASFLPGSRYRTDKPGPVERCDAHVVGTNDNAGPERSDCRSFLPDS